MKTARPAREAPEGYKLVARQSRGWRPSAGKRCRRAHCGKPCVAELKRTADYRQPGRRDAWWPYCAEHMAEYGHWIEDGQVTSWYLWPLDPCPETACLLNAGHDRGHYIHLLGDPVYARGLPQESGSGDE
jgi:hypothetical protein